MANVQTQNKVSLHERKRDFLIGLLDSTNDVYSEVSKGKMKKIYKKILNSMKQDANEKFVLDGSMNIDFDEYTLLRNNAECIKEKVHIGERSDDPRINIDQTKAKALRSFEQIARNVSQAWEKDKVVLTEEQVLALNGEYNKTDDEELKDALYSFFEKDEVLFNMITKEETKETSTGDVC